MRRLMVTLAVVLVVAVADLEGQGHGAPAAPATKEATLAAKAPATPAAKAPAIPQSIPHARVELDWHAPLLVWPEELLRTDAPASR